MIHPTRGIIGLLMESDKKKLVINANMPENAVNIKKFA
jgi:hypothetical protein